MEPSYRYELKLKVERATYTVELAKDHLSRDITTMLLTNLGGLSGALEKPLTPNRLDYLESGLRLVAAQSEIAGLYATAMLLDDARQSISMEVGSLATTTAALQDLWEKRDKYHLGELRSAVFACVKRYSYYIPRVLAVFASIAAIIGLYFLLRGCP